jgi:hypothetical protein
VSVVITDEAGVYFFAFIAARCRCAAAVLAFAFDFERSRVAKCLHGGIDQQQTKRVMTDELLMRLEVDSP